MKRINILALTVIILLPSCKSSVHKVSRTMMGTIINLTVISDTEAAAGATEAAFNEIKRIDELMSSYKAGSDVSRINRFASKRAVKVNRETYLMIKRSLEISDHTEGAFDITFKSISHLWNYKSENFIPPSQNTIMKYKYLVNYKNIILFPDMPGIRFRNEGMKIGLGGIAKGYAIQMALKALKEKGVKAGIVDAGGDLQVFGTKFGDPWKTGLMHPRKRSLYLILNLDDMEAIATSGDYERVAVYRGERYHHIIDPRTGFPTETFSSVSVISKDPVISDSYATSIFVMGLGKAKEFLEKHKEIAVIMIDFDNNAYISRALQKKIEVLEKKVNIKWI